MVSDDWGYIRESVVLRTSSAADTVYQTSQQWRHALESILNTHQEMKLTLDRFAGNPNQALQKKSSTFHNQQHGTPLLAGWLVCISSEILCNAESGLKQPWGQLSQIQTGQQAPVKLPQLISFLTHFWLCCKVPKNMSIPDEPFVTLHGATHTHTHTQRAVFNQHTSLTCTSLTWQSFEYATANQIAGEGRTKILWLIN